MRTDKKGKIHIQRGDHRAGNFVFHQEGAFIKVMPISGIVTWRISTYTSIGSLVAMAIKDGKDEYLRTYAAATFSQLCVVPDAEFFEKHAALINEHVEKHPEHYGKTPPPDDEKDKKIIEEEREIQDEISR